MRKAFLLFLLLTCFGNSRAQLIITELMQSNIDCIMDDLNEFPDSWVELYNAGSSSAELSEYSIGLSSVAADAWRLPQKTIAAGAYIIVYCDKESKGLHTNFRLETSKGGEVHLFRNGKSASFVTSIPKQPTPGISYAFYPEAAEQWAYACAPTPKAANTSPASSGLLPDPQFSLEAGTYQTQQTLTLSLPDDAPAGAIIRYTRDGSEPTASSQRYTTPLAVIRTQPIRAKAFCDGWASPRSVTRSYIFPDHNIKLPIVSIAIDNKYLSDPQVGILVDGSYSSSTKNYQYDWRRPMNFELFEPDGSTCSINQLCEGRVMGAASRGQALKSMAIYTHKRYAKKHFNYEFFPDQRPDATDYQSILIRNAGNDFDYLYMRDAIIQRTMGSHTDIDWQAWRPAVVFINGQYKGILNIRDRSNDDNIYTHYDRLEDIDIVKNNYELQHGTWDNFNAFKAFYNEHGHTYDEYARWLDLDEYIAIMAMNLYYGNLDFPGNNIVMWRPRTEGGRWRIIAKDTDYALGIYDLPSTYNMIQWINNADHDGSHNWANQWDHTRLFRRLMEDQEFRNTFLERCAIYMGDFMNERGTRATWDAMYKLIRDEYPIHRKLYNQWWPNYSEELTKGQNWLNKRTATHYNHLSTYYGTGHPVPLVINGPLSPFDRQGFRIDFNGVELSETYFNGRFYQGNTVHLTSRPALPDDVERFRRMKLCAEGKLPSDFTSSPTPLEVKGWKVTIIGTNGTTSSTEYQGSELHLEVPNCASLQIVAVTEEASAVDQLCADQNESANTAFDILDLQGRSSSGQRPGGIYLKRSANGTYRKVVLR